MTSHRATPKGRSALPAALAITWSLVLAGPTLAVDGVIEINQARALAGGVSTGDTAGFPVTISASGSYRLTGNLAPAAGPVNVIEIDADRVVLDLNGFSIQGSTTCTQSGALPNVISCTPGGIVTSAIAGTAAVNVQIKNGNIGGTTGKSIDLENTAFVQLDDLNVGSSASAAACVHLGDVAHVKGTVVGLCVGDGIRAGNSSEIEDSSGSACNGEGIEVGLSARVEGSFAQGNAGSGLTCLGYCFIENNQFSFNGVDGVQSTGFGSMFNDNIASNNLGWGAQLNSNSGYSRNVFHSNVTGHVTGGASAGDNACGGASC